jgi:hypothetical protein
MSDTAPYLGLARHTEPDPILYTWVNKMSVARMAARLSSPALTGQAFPHLDAFLAISGYFGRISHDARGWRLRPANSLKALRGCGFTMLAFVNPGCIALTNLIVSILVSRSRGRALSHPPWGEPPGPWPMARSNASPSRAERWPIRDGGSARPPRCPIQISRALRGPRKAGNHTAIFD